MEIKRVGRLLVRAGSVIGVFVPSADSLEPGLYDLVSVAGEIMARRVGAPAVEASKFNVEGVLERRPATMMTEAELRDLEVQGPHRRA